MTSNGNTPDFTHHLGSFTVNGHEFRRRKIPARQWAETLQSVARQENAEIEKADGSVLFAVSADGLNELIRLGIEPDDLVAWDRMWDDGLLEFGELAALRDWMWEQMTERPFISGSLSSDGPGNDSDPSSKAASRSPEAAQKG